ncbi:hydrolase 1, exosortase A system-associated [Telluria mixta]|uniref:Hydrolase 1, exosortase A system-associated n=1 Tax=Telluria mixta TaxID=34071 RepID=A0ABT2BVW9_9BURK|nr:hydrolase 1, exosortase A system-associated [Telluria mixta]MCS0629276.1 hydrolase 1, exosortase A system-associated [Telluria mixta]WEM97711.1 hydrolase 1, exosortase A system-associated [Telluria mixta]
MSYDERALAFRCGGAALVGIASVPAGECSRGVLVVVGGPQYRVGSHRQFALLARHLAENGIAAMRFDYRGMGDSDGEERDFEAIQDDIRAALDAFIEAVPGLTDVVLWGLCDGASAAAMYAPGDARVRGLVLLNPWVRTDDGVARTTLKHHYRDRLRSPEFWRKLARGQFDYAGSLTSMLKLVRTAFAGRPADQGAAASLPERMHHGLHVFTGHTLLVIGGADLTGREFCDVAGSSPAWKRLVATPRVSWRRIEDADHTFSRRAWRDQVAEWTREWVASL